MNKLLSVSLLGLVLLAAVPSLAVEPTTSDPTKPFSFTAPLKHEAVSVTLKPGWFLAHKFVHGGMFGLQFLPAGGDPKTARTLINVVTYYGAQAKTNARTFAKNEEKKAPDLAKPGKIDFKFIEDTNPDDVIYQLSLSGNPKFPDQFEVHRILTGKDGIHTIIYHVQPATQTESQIAEMIDVVKAVKIVAPPKQSSKK